MICKACQKPFETSAPNAKYCPVCQNEERRRKKLESNQRWKQKKRAALEGRKATATSTSKSLTKVAAEARAHGMSYGQWVAKGEYERG